MRLTLWGDEVGKIVENESYNMTGVTVRSYLRKKFISTSVENCSIERCEDIGDVKEEDEVNEGPSVQPQKVLKV